MLALTLESKKCLEILKKLTILNLHHYKLNYKIAMQNSSKCKMQKQEKKAK